MTEQQATEEKAIALFHGDAEKVHPLARFGERKVVMALAQRIQMTDSRKVPLNKMESVLYAQSALAYGLDPFMGEIVAFVQMRWNNDTKRKERALTIMKGRDGVLKISKENARRAGTHLLPPRFEIIPSDDPRRALYGYGAEDMLVWCRVEDHESVTLWQERYNSMKDGGAKHAEIIKQIGDSPADTGLGVIEKSELESLKKSSGKFTNLERCQKRALTAALRKRWAPQEYQMEHALETSAETDDYIIDQSWLEGEYREVAEDDASEEAVKEAGSKAKETLYGKDAGDDGIRRAGHSWPVNFIEATKSKMHPDERTIVNATAILNLSPCSPKDPADVIGSWVVHYLSARYDDNLDIKAAQAKADKNYKKKAGA